MSDLMKNVIVGEIVKVFFEGKRYYNADGVCIEIPGQLNNLTRFVMDELKMKEIVAEIKNRAEKEKIYDEIINGAIDELKEIIGNKSWSWLDNSYEIKKEIRNALTKAIADKILADKKFQEGILKNIDWSKVNIEVSIKAKEIE